MHNYPIITIMVVLWAMALVTGTMIGVFMIADEVNAALASIVAAVIGLPSAAFTLYQTRMEIRERQEEQELKR